jgi:hypothetical protein
MIKFMAKKLSDVSDEELIIEENPIDKLPFQGNIGPSAIPWMKLIDNIRRSMEMQRRLKKTMAFSSWVMIFLTIVLIALTVVLVLQGFK